MKQMMINIIKFAVEVCAVAALLITYIDVLALACIRKLTA